MRFRKSYIVIVWFMIWSQHVVLAQQTPLFPEYNYNPFVINPAYAGMAPGSVVSVSHNRHVNNMEGTPVSSSLSFHSPLSDGKMGLGAAIIRDEIGVTSATSAVLAYSYKLFF